MFTKDSRAERFLDTLGVKWRYTNDMTLGRLVPGWATHNLGRSEAKVKTAVAEYAKLAESGSLAPAPILGPCLAVAKDRDRMEVLDGIQRLLVARQRDISRFSAYVIETDSAVMLQKIRIFANKALQGGHQESAEWTMAQAINRLVNVHDEHGHELMTIDEVAELGGWTPAAVRRKQGCMGLGTKIRGIGGPEQLPDTLLAVVLQHADPADFDVARKPVAAFLNDVKKAKLNTDDATPYIEQFFNVARSKGNLHDAFTAKLEEFRADDETVLRLTDPSKRRHKAISGDTRLMKSLKSSLTIAEDIFQKGERVLGMAEYYQKLSQTRKVLEKIEKASKRR